MFIFINMKDPSVKQLLLVFFKAFAKVSPYTNFSASEPNRKECGWEKPEASPNRTEAEPKRVRTEPKPSRSEPEPNRSRAEASPNRTEAEPKRMHAKLKKTSIEELTLFLRFLCLCCKWLCKHGKKSTRNHTWRALISVGEKLVTNKSKKTRYDRTVQKSTGFRV